MGETEIGWTHRPGTVGRTWNFTRGCFPISPGCANCYACRQGARFSGPGKPYDGLVKLTKGGPPKWTGKGMVVEHTLVEPFSWRDPSTVFVDSMSDLFFDAFTFQEIAAGFAVMAMTQDHTYLILTKRPERAAEFFAMLGDDWHQWLSEAYDMHVRPHRADLVNRTFPPKGTITWPLPNVALGVSVESQEYTHRIDTLMRLPAATRMLSLEPLLGPIDLLPWLDPTGACCGSAELQCSGCPANATWRHTEDGDDPAIDWVILGAESGPRARACEATWIESIVERCQDYNVATFVKQACPTDDPTCTVTAGPGSAVHGKGHNGLPMITAPYVAGKQCIEFPRFGNDPQCDFRHEHDMVEDRPMGARCEKTATHFIDWGDGRGSLACGDHLEIDPSASVKPRKISRIGELTDAA